MFKVLIIDDEPIIRKGLRNVINWRNFECEVCGEAEDGLEGSALIESCLPDIIITDIRMPEVDGLTMLRDMKEKVPNSKIIILTGHRNFDYVQEAIKIGAFDFLLKPSKIEELNDVISRAVKEIKFQRERAEEFDKLRVLFDQNIPVLREKFLYDVIYEINTSKSEILEKLELFNIKLESFIVLIVQQDADESNHKFTNQYDRHLYQFGIINNFSEVFFDKFEVISITLNDTGIAFLVMPHSGNTEDVFEVIDRKCTYLQDIISNCFGFTVTIAVSSQGTKAEELLNKYKECREALEHKIYLGNNSIIYQGDVNTFFKYDDHSILEKLQKALIEGIKSGNSQMVTEKLNEIYAYIKSNESVNIKFVKSFCQNTVTMISNIRMTLSSADNEKKNEADDLSGAFTLIEKSDSFDELHVILCEIANNITSKINSYNNKSIRLVLRKAIEYMKTHYHEQVTLNEVAEHTFVSTYYISRMFKREMGINFVDYLNEIRIEKAKKMLKDVRFKTYEVAERVGIPDAHYFSKMFKKYVGVTPTEFRDQE